jgi:hypothetical protein
MSAAINGRAELRERALVRLKKRTEFRGHVLAYVLVNGLHLGIWAVVWTVTGFGFFWPIFPAIGWGIGLAFHWWDVYRRDDRSQGPTEEQIRREMDALQRPSTTPSGRR